MAARARRSRHRAPVIRRRKTRSTSGRCSAGSSPAQWAGCATRACACTRTLRTSHFVLDRHPAPPARDRGQPRSGHGFKFAHRGGRGPGGPGGRRPRALRPLPRRPRSSRRCSLLRHASSRPASLLAPLLRGRPRRGAARGRPGRPHARVYTGRRAPALGRRAGGQGRAPRRGRRPRRRRRAHVGGATTIVDAGGRLVLPGFIDAHFHLPMGAQQLDAIDLLDAADLGDPAPRPGVGPQASRRALDPWARLVLLRASRRPPAHAAGPRRGGGGRPVYLEAYDGHSAWVNTRGLERAGITRATADPTAASSSATRPASRRAC